MESAHTLDRPLAWWWPPAVLLALLLLWPLLVSVVAGPVPPNHDGWFQRSRFGSWNAAYGQAITPARFRSTTAQVHSEPPVLHATPWARSFPIRMLTLALIFTIVGLVCFRWTGRGPGSPEVRFICITLACWPWGYLLVSSGAHRGYGELLAALLDTRAASSELGSSHALIHLGTRSDAALALMALVLLGGMALLFIAQTIGRWPRLADLLQLDLEERDPGRLLASLPKLQAAVVVSAATSDSSSSARGDA